MGQILGRVESTTPNCTLIYRVTAFKSCSLGWIERTRNFVWKPRIHPAKSFSCSLAWSDRVSNLVCIATSIHSPLHLWYRRSVKRYLIKSITSEPSSTYLGECKSVHGCRDIYRVAAIRMIFACVVLTQIWMPSVLIRTSSL